MQAVLAALGVQQFDMVTHDIGDMVGFARGLGLGTGFFGGAMDRLASRIGSNNHGAGANIGQGQPR